MPERITEEERKRFHNYLDAAIDKMNRPKNSGKTHWSTMPIEMLQKLANVENAELDEAVFCHLHGIYPSESVIEECFDGINLKMMIIDNLVN